MGTEDIISLLLNYKYFIMLWLMIIEWPITSFISAFLSLQWYFNFLVVYVLSVMWDVIWDIMWFVIWAFGSRQIVKRFFSRFTEKIKNKSIYKKIKKQIDEKPLITLFIIKITPPISIPGLILFWHSKTKFGKFVIYTFIICFILESIFVNLWYFSSISINVFKNKFDNIVLTITAIFVWLLMLSIWFLIIKKLRKKLKINWEKDFNL